MTCNDFNHGLHVQEPLTQEPLTHTQTRWDWLITTISPPLPHKQNEGYTLPLARRLYRIEKKKEHFPGKMQNVYITMPAMADILPRSFQQYFACNEARWYISFEHLDFRINCIDTSAGKTVIMLTWEECYRAFTAGAGHRPVRRGKDRHDKQLLPHKSTRICLLLLLLLLLRWNS